MSRKAVPNFLDDDDDDPFQDIIQSSSQAPPSSTAPASHQQRAGAAPDPFDDPPNPFPSPQQPSNQHLDPFFDDDDDDAYAPRGPSSSTLNVFSGGGGGSYQAPQGLTSGRYGGGNKSIEADLPLTQHAAAPAGRQSTLADGSGEQDYQFAPHLAARRSQPSSTPAAAAAWFRNVDWAEYSPRELLRRQGKVVEGVPRRIALNDEAANREGNNGGRFEKNSVSTGKYNVVSFLPIFLFGTSPLLRRLPARRSCVRKLTLMARWSLQSNSLRRRTSSSCSPVRLPWHAQAGRRLALTPTRDRSCSPACRSLHHAGPRRLADEPLHDGPSARPGARRVGHQGGRGGPRACRPRPTRRTRDPSSR